MKRFLLPLTAVVIVVIMLIIALTKKEPVLTPQAVAYLQKTYPLADKTKLDRRFFDGLDFYWYSPKVTAPFFKRVATKASRSSNPKFVCPSYVSCKPTGPNNAVFRNLYVEGTKNEALPSFKSNQLVEVYHSKYYEEPGLYYYAAKGSGIFLNLGKTLVARNKIDALFRLGMTDTEVLQTMTFFMRPNNKLQSTFGVIAGYTAKNKISFSESLALLMKQARNGETFLTDSFNLSLSADYTLYLLAKKQGYDTIQFTNQINPDSGWGFEIADVRMDLSNTLNQRWVNERKYLFIADPFNTKHRAPCNYFIPFKVLRCTQAPSIDKPKPN